MEYRPNEVYPLSERMDDVAKILLFLKRVLPPTIDYCDDKARMGEVLEGVTALSRVLSPLAVAAATECNELEEAYQSIKEKE